MLAARHETLQQARRDAADRIKRLRAGGGSRERMAEADAAYRAAVAELHEFETGERPHWAPPAPGSTSTTRWRSTSMARTATTRTPTTRRCRTRRQSDHLVHRQAGGLGARRLRRAVEHGLRRRPLRDARCRPAHVPRRPVHRRGDDPVVGGGRDACPSHRSPAEHVGHRDGRRHARDVSGRCVRRHQLRVADRPQRAHRRAAPGGDVGGRQVAAAGTPQPDAVDRRRAGDGRCRRGGHRPAETRTRETCRPERWSRWPSR